MDSLQVHLICKNQQTDQIEEYTGELPIIIGRSAEFSNFVIMDRSISRQHVRIVLENNDVVVFDLNSSNGTFVNGKRIERAVLKKDDIIGLGSMFQVLWKSLHPESNMATMMEALPPSAQATIVQYTPKPTEPLPPAPAATPPTRSATAVPARDVVERATEFNQQAGHEIEGFLSFEHGFLPYNPPLLAMPESHRVWDTIADVVPQNLKTLELRRVIDQMPVLSAAEDALPDKYLLRAATMFGVFAHSYHYVETDPPERLPDCILKPWQDITRRLGRSVPYFSYADMFLYNWKLRDTNGPRNLENMQLLVPTWNNEAERVFYLATTEVAEQFTPILSAMIKAQEAATDEDRTALEEALLVILDKLQYLTQVVYPKFDVNPYSKSHIDQVLWAKTVGTFGVPVIEGAPSPSGTATPHIYALDAFLSRQSYETLVAKQTIYLFGHAPRHWQELAEALRQVSVRDYVEKSQNSALRGLYNTVLDAYAGDKGFLGLHRIKAYGFLEVAFKVGRTVTLGAKFTGLFRDKMWDKIDGELAVVRDERYLHGNQHVYFAHPKRGIVSTDPETGAWIDFIELDVTGTGIRYQPGDRIGVLSENSDTLVQKTLRALQATGDEIIHLTPQWEEALRFRAGYSEDHKVLPLKTVLTYGKIRPVMREVAKRLHKISASGALKRIIDARMEDQWELWDMLNVLYSGGYDVTRLWKSGPWDAESICRVVPPEVFRLYSIASAMDVDSEQQTLKLIVGGLDYKTPHTPYSYMQPRSGTASHFMRRITTEAKYRDKPISLLLVPTSRFHLPENSARPVIMFAGGSGIAPFMGFMQARTTQQDSGENWLFFGTRSQEQFYNRQYLEQVVGAGKLELRMAFSRADVAARFDAKSGQFTFEKAKRQRINDVIESAGNAAAIWNFLRSEEEGGQHGYFYICGRTGFAMSVMESLRNVIRQFTGGSEQEVNSVIRRMIAEGRYMQDIFTTYTGTAQEGTAYNISDLVLHNNPAAGYWMAVSGKVYDMTEFMYQHVGGEYIIIHNAGIDATSAYQGVQHHVNSEIDAMLGMYELGTMRRLQFEDSWGVVLTPSGLKYMPLDELFKSWVRYLYLVVAMENALTNDYAFEGMASTGYDAPNEVTPFKMQYLIESHRRFLVSYLDGLIDEDLQAIWATTISFCDKDQDIRSLKAEIDALIETPSYQLVRRSIAYIKGILFSTKEMTDDQTKADTLNAIQMLCSLFKQEDKRVLNDMKLALREGILAFEEYEIDVIAQGSETLIAAVKAVIVAVGDYYQRLADQISGLGIVLNAIPDNIGEEPIPEDAGLPGHGGKI